MSKPCRFSPLVGRIPSCLPTGTERQAVFGRWQQDSTTSKNFRSRMWILSSSNSPGGGPGPHLHHHRLKCRTLSLTTNDSGQKKYNQTGSRDRAETEGVQKWQLWKVQSMGKCSAKRQSPLPVEQTSTHAYGLPAVMGPATPPGGGGGGRGKRKELCSHVWHVMPAEA